MVSKEKELERTVQQIRGNGSKEIKTPAFHCASCDKRIKNRCEFYHRPVVADYNRCFNHSYYSPIHIEFRPIANLEEIIEKEEGAA